jgi:hypothetical protein
MKKIIKLIGIASVLVVISINSFAQVTASATATATIVTPIAITKDANMNFGNLAVSAGGGGVVTMTPSGSPVRTQIGGVTFPAVTGTVQAAYFLVTGTPDYTYSITLPSTNHMITRIGFTEQMIVNAFTSNPSPTGVLDGSGNGSFYVGANVIVAGGQAAGVYTSTGAGFDVIVNYN